MSWASSRHTTRPEDMAYCLLGIFGIHMSLIYGERDKAFIRLQEEIAKEGMDMSIFAWVRPQIPASGDQKVRKFRGIFAESPSEFSWCQKIPLVRSRVSNFINQVTSAHGCLTFNTILGAERGRRDGRFLDLEHQCSSSESSQRLGISVEQTRTDSSRAPPRTSSALFLTMSPRNKSRSGKPLPRENHMPKYSPEVVAPSVLEFKRKGEQVSQDQPNFSQSSLGPGWSIFLRQRFLATLCRCRGRH
jgi:hypothetical protein